MCHDYINVIKARRMAGHSSGQGCVYPYTTEISPVAAKSRDLIGDGISMWLL